VAAPEASAFLTVGPVDPLPQRLNDLLRDRDGRRLQTRRRTYELQRRWVVYVSSRTGRSEVYVRPFPSGDLDYKVSVEGGGQPRWRSGTELFFLTLDANMTSTRVAAGKTFESAVPQKLFATGIPPLWFLHNNAIYDVTQDGQRFIMPVIPRDEYHAYIADELAGAGAEIAARWTTVPRRTDPALRAVRQPI
jgi:hypothetical protein